MQPSPGYNAFLHKYLFYSYSFERSSVRQMFKCTVVEIFKKWANRDCKTDSIGYRQIRENPGLQTPRSVLFLSVHLEQCGSQSMTTVEAASVTFTPSESCCLLNIGVRTAHLYILFLWDHF